MLGPDAGPGTPEFDLFVKQLVVEMTVKAGQKCTAICRALVPQALVDALEHLAASGPRKARRMPTLLLPLRFALWCSGMIAAYRDRDQALGELRKWVANRLRPFTAR